MTQREENRRPGMMRIIAEVAKCANMATDGIISPRRNARSIHARAAVYKLAAEYGYPRSEIMWFLDRDRTVGYNYESNLDGHLSRSPLFKALIEAASAALRECTHRAEGSPQGKDAESAAAEANAAEEERKREPEFKPWKGKLGWRFTADEVRRERQAEEAAAEFMKAYGQPNRPKSPTPQLNSIPTEMTTMDAAIYLNVSPSFLAKGVALGCLHRHKKPNISSYWYATAELDNFRQYIADHKRGAK